MPDQSHRLPITSSPDAGSMAPKTDYNTRAVSILDLVLWGTTYLGAGQRCYDEVIVFFLGDLRILWGGFPLEDTWN